ncbi:MAG: hypothetical protein A2046_16560 [Bacteroidetes bacterium GWA2_30_7]|nr:MAG: hypothetical protein A2046_16560 [Bacteroidetes bacterium GWA2_30_7]
MAVTAQVYDRNWEIKTDQGTTSKEYVGRDYIKLQKGFKWTKGSAGQKFVARLDENITFDASYNTTDIDPVSNFTTSLAVGSTAGSYAVSPTGAATYNIPIIIPPGTAGMQPNVSIAYNSQAGNGLLGIGWELTGMSAITRTNKTIYYNSEVKEIKLDNTDVFAIDGQKMFYSSTLAGYYTETENFSKITQATSTVTAKIYFEVKTKSGSIIEYGNTNNSCIEAQGNTAVLLWLINKVTDNNGNYITFTYTENNTDGTFRIDKIEYTGNATAGLNPYNSIEFFYENRADVNDLYVAGSIVRNDILLNKIKTKQYGNTVKEYEFKYLKTTDDFCSKLNEVIEYGFDGSRINSTVVNWGAISTSETSSGFIPSYNTDDNYLYGDYNGDGYTDYIKYSQSIFDFSNACEMYLNNGGSYSTPISFTPNGYVIITPTYHTVSVSDFNGDGKDEFITIKQNPIPHFIPNPYYSDAGYYTDEYGNKYEPETYPSDTDWDNYIDVFDLTWHPDFPTIINPAANSQYSYVLNLNFLKNGVVTESPVILYLDNLTAPLTGDFNGDGISDFIIESNVFFGSNSTSLNPMSKHAISSMPYTILGIDIFVPASNIINGSNISLTDIDGDGKTEIMVKNTSSTTTYELEPNATDPNIYDLISVSTEYLGQGYYPGDFNGDGKTDFLVVNEILTVNIYEIWYSKGNGFVQGYCPLPISADNDKIFVSDFNNDGKSDIIKFNQADWWSNNNKIKIYYSYGKGKDITVNNFKTEEFDYLKSLFGGSPKFNIGDFNGDGQLDFLINSDKVSFHKGEQRNLVQAITNGMNFKTEFVYEPVAKSTVCINNNLNLMSFNLVRSVKTDNGLGGINQTDYLYNTPKYNPYVNSFLGFSSIKLTNSTLLTEITNTFQNSITSQDGKVLFGNFLYSTLIKKGGSTLKTETLTNNAYHFSGYDKRYFVYQSKLQSVDGLTGVSITKDYEYNTTDILNGNLTSETTNYGTTATATKSYTYIAKGSVYPNRVSAETITNTRTGESNYTRSIEYNYYDNGNLKDMTTDPSKTINVLTEYEYDYFGNIKKTTVTPSDADLRFSTVDYDSKGRFPVKTTNPMGFVTEATYDNRTGNMLTKKDINGLTTSYQYDNFGRLITTTLPNHQKVNSSINWYSGSLTNVVYYIRQWGDNIPEIKEYYDSFGRKLLTETIGFDNKTVTVENYYNSKGLLYATSLPYYSGDIREYKVTDYDNYGRILHSGDNNKTFTYTYLNNKVTVSDNVTSETTSKEYDASGLLLTATTNTIPVTYTYYASGLPHTITSNGNTVTMYYDDYGRQTILDDPDAGITNYTYNSIGELIYQKDARTDINTATTMTYDKLGRIKTKTLNGGADVYTYTYDAGLKGTLSNVTAPNGTEQLYKYNNYGQVTQLSEKIDAENFVTSYKYNNFGNLTQTVYPSGFAVNYSYDDKGIMLELKRADNGNSIWKMDAVNALGQITQYTSGSGKVTNKTYNSYGFAQEFKTPGVMDYTFDFDMARGNLKSRADIINNQKEFFSYDNFNQLTQIDDYTQENTIAETTSDSYGNINYKTEAGNYFYDPARPHAVNQVDNANATTYNAIPSFNQDITWNEFNKASIISENDRALHFTYGVDGERRKTVFYFDGEKEKTKYFSANYEKIILGDGASTETKEVHYIHGGDGLAAICVKESDTYTMHYTYTDYLGSILAITDESGNIEEKLSYDAWGRRRNPLDWSLIPAFDDDFTSTITDRGFTGHEHLDAFGLINMNGRLYDPVLGRMLSPDNFLSPQSPLGMNRYCYANNNPLKFTDPSGNMPAVVVWLIYNVVRNAIQYLVNRRNGMSNDEALQNQVWTLSYNGNMPNSWYGKNSTIPSDPINGGSGMYNNSVIADKNTPLNEADYMSGSYGLSNYSLDYEFGGNVLINFDNPLLIEAVNMNTGDISYTGFVTFSDPVKNTSAMSAGIEILAISKPNQSLRGSRLNALDQRLGGTGIESYILYTKNVTYLTAREGNILLKNGNAEKGYVYARVYQTNLSGEYPVKPNGTFYTSLDSYYWITFPRVIGNFDTNW